VCIYFVFVAFFVIFIPWFVLGNKSVYILYSVHGVVYIKMSSLL